MNVELAFWRMVERELATPRNWLLKLEQHELDVKCSNGNYVTPPGTLSRVVVVQDGAKCDVSFTLCGTAIVHKTIMTRINEASQENIQFFPTTLEGFWIANFIHSVDCLDRISSNIEWFPSDLTDPALQLQPELAGKPRYVYGFQIDPAQIPDGIDVFRVRDWPTCVVVRKTLKNAIANATGIAFRMINLS